MTMQYLTEKKVGTKESGFKVGDILCGTTHMYRTQTHWYQIVSMTKKLLTLKELNVSYPTQYMSNTPGDNCMPVLEFGDQYILINGYPYWSGPYRQDKVTASVQRFKRYDDMNEMPDEKMWIYEADIRGDKYAPLLSLWDGKPGWVNCD